MPDSTPHRFKYCLLPIIFSLAGLALGFACSSEEKGGQDTSQEVETALLSDNIYDTGQEVDIELVPAFEVLDVPIDEDLRDQGEQIKDIELEPEALEEQVETEPEDTMKLDVAEPEGDTVSPSEDVENIENIQPQCTTPQDCIAKLGVPDQCFVFNCIDNQCIQEPAEAGTQCDDGDLCTNNDVCDGSGVCAGEPIVCDDDDICTQDSCDPQTGLCSFVDIPPQPCQDAQGNPGVKTCTNNQWSPCVVQGPCNLLVNTNDTGTVNPSIFPARNGQFYISYVAHEDEGGNLRLVWAEPLTCTVAAGPYMVNTTPGAVYYWGSQWAISDDAGNFYAVWETKGTSSDVAFAYSETGDEFSDPVYVVSTSENGIYPALGIVAPGSVVVAWSGLYQGQYDPFLSSNPAVLDGAPFLPAVQVAATSIQDDNIAIAVDSSGNIYVAWQSFPDGTPQGGNIYVAKSTDGGQTFTQPVQVNDVNSKAHVGNAGFIAWGNGKLYVVWSDTRTDSEGDIYLDSSTDGITFGNDVMVNDNTYRYQEDPTVVVGKGPQCAGHVYVVWQDLRSNQSYDIYGAVSTNQGQSFGQNLMLNPVGEGDQMNPAVGVDAACVVGVAWRDSSENQKFDIKATFLTSWE